MRIIAVTNQKGGSGKTTTSVSLAAALGEMGRRVLLLDLDSQASASSWYGVRDAGKGLYSVFVESAGLGDTITNTNVLGVSIAPASAWLVGVDRALASEVGAETILRSEIAKLPANTWDYVLIDCPPALGILTINALTAAREVLVPVEAHVMALSGLAQLLRTVETVSSRLNPDLEITGIVACRVDARTRHSLEVVEQLKGRFGNVFHNVYIRENVRLAEAPSFSQPITLFDSRSNGAKDYRALAEAVIKQERKRK